MSRLIRTILVAVVLFGSLPALPAVATVTTSTCTDGTQSSGALYRICMPDSNDWNGDLVVFAHGYVAPDEPVAIPEDQLELPGGLYIPEIINKLGLAFATTSYSTNGLAVLEGGEDLRDLVDIFVAMHGQPRHVYLVGGSEGGIITALAVEQFPEVFDGGLAACGPVGDFHWQVNYWGDFRVVFDYFFPELIPGDPFDIPQELINDWDSYYENVIRPVIFDPANQCKINQLLRVTHIPTDRRDPASVEEAIRGLLWYNVFATNDGIDKLGGQPFDNMHRFYRGSDNDFRLNLEVQRFLADPAALDEIEAHYQTSGQLASPLVTLHTTGDSFVPYWHEPLYGRKVRASDSGLLHSNIPILRYGHCNFKASEVLVAFALLVFKVTKQELTGVEDVLPDADSRAEFLQLARQYGALR
jgi:pimeloyl-ACP methyl ester carboxylesterase